MTPEVTWCSAERVLARQGGLRVQIHQILGEDLFDEAYHQSTPANQPCILLGLLEPYTDIRCKARPSYQSALPEKTYRVDVVAVGRSTHHS